MKGANLLSSFMKIDELIHEAYEDTHIYTENTHSHFKRFFFLLRKRA